MEGIVIQRSDRQDATHNACIVRFFGYKVYDPFIIDLLGKTRISLVHVRIKHNAMLL